MTNTQTAIIAAAVLGAAAIVGVAVSRPWEAFRPEPAVCINPPSDPIAAQQFAMRFGCRLR